MRRETSEPGVVGPLLHYLLHYAGRERLVEVECPVVGVWLEEGHLLAARMHNLSTLAVETKVVVAARELTLSLDKRVEV